MALDLAGIGNVGEFYSQHYLDSLFAGDVKNTLKGWAATEADGGAKTPAKRLAGLANRFFTAAAKAAGNPDPEARLEPAREFHAYLIEVLAYTREPTVATLHDESIVPLLLEHNEGGRPHLWVMEAPFAKSDDEAEPLDESPHRSQLPAAVRDDDSLELAPGTYRQLLDGALFRGEHPPRWVLLLAGSDAFLIDRGKWSQGKYLHFALGALFGRREPKALQATAALLHAEVLLPAGGQSLLDRIDEQSHKHAYAVSTDLKLGAQRAIELIANEAVRHLREVSKEEVFGRDELATDLTRECIVYLYRLLFLFYVEARSQETGVVPMGSEDYRRGYSLESLRDLELVPLTTVQAREGTYLDASLRRLFRIVQHGYPRGYQTMLQEGEDAPVDQMTIAPLRSALFDDEKTPTLRRVKLRNVVLQEVLQLLSLSKEGKKRARGRISYAQLGINQLGAVYEGLLSYRGFFARKDLYEVARASDVGKPDVQTYFVGAEKIGDYEDAEILKDEYGRKLQHERGTYLFRLAGRDREKSASYYTPQVLTECLVKYTLMERLGESFGVADTRPAEDRLPELSADEILELTICEPAMGSGAFLNEAIDQLAHKYLKKKQAELGETIPAEQYPEEHARVKYHFAVNCCYGVDLNPLAAELGKVSLWLNVLHQGALAPFLDLRIVVGNSLVGARREVFHSADLIRKNRKDDPNWLGKTPARVPLVAEGNDKSRPRGTVYHFLVPDVGMAPFEKDKVVKALEPEAVKKLKAWRKRFCRPFDEMEVARLEALSDRVDVLWQAHLVQRREVLAKVRPVASVWPAPMKRALGELPTDALVGEEMARELVTPGDEKGGARLQRVMSYWCALWFWPLSEVDGLPSREQWLGDLEAITDPGGVRGEADAGRLRVVQGLVERERYLHWEAAFPEVFADRGGMDVMVGNPPWLKVEWKEAGVLSDYEPSLAVRKLSAKLSADARAAVLDEEAARAGYLTEYESLTAMPSFLNATQNYPLLKGVQTNLYKCFMTAGVRLGATQGVSAFYHQPGIYDDPKGGALRGSFSPRLVLACRFKNERMLFAEIDHQRPYALTLARATPRVAASFFAPANLFHPATLDESFAHDGQGPVPGIKDEDGKWILRGHASRLVPVDQEALELFAQLYDEPGTPALEARLPVVHSRELLGVLRRFAEAPKLGPNGERWQTTREWHEGDRTKDGTIVKGDVQPSRLADAIFGGPHFFVANPFAKSPRVGCRHNQDYDLLDHSLLARDFVPRSLYAANPKQQEGQSAMPHWQGKSLFSRFRHMHREMVAPTGERTLVPALLPPGPAALHLVFTVAHVDHDTMVAFSGMAAGLPVDFFVKSMGVGHINVAQASLLPIPVTAHAELIRLRALRLNALTEPFAPLWTELFHESWPTETSASDDLRAGSYSGLSPRWMWETPFRTPYARRQALVELDALAALSLNMTLDELLLIYRVQFPVLQQYERETFYDQRGKIVFTVNRGLAGVGLTRKQWQEVQHAQAGDELPEWAHDQQGPYEPPFDSCDREEDMAQAYRFFEKKTDA